jgi:hypothetical protein
MRISANRIVPLKRRVATIHPRLRVWILPVDSKVESSNMGASLSFEPYGLLAQVRPQASQSRRREALWARELSFA